ncbi:MAG: TRAP transporter substrate-binding protein DctP [Deltaproteobacteria bacterium]|nr:TRAP transporter substrate-binding protein DctP [Deltaproteobacteria bacterium]
MKAISRSLAFFVMAAFVLVTGAPVPQDAEAKIILKIPTQSARPGTPRADYLVRFEKAVEKRTNGEIDVQIFWANSLVHAKEALEAVQLGTADMSDLAVGYFSDKIRLLQVAGLPFTISDPVKAWQGTERVLKQIPEASAELTKFGHKVVGMTATASYQLVAHDPIRNLADLKGKKVGTFGRIAPKAIKAGGGIPVSTTGGEMYEALQRKTIDARILSFEAAQRFKTYEVAKYMSKIEMGCIAGVSMFTINQRKWDSLSKEHQKIILEEGDKAGRWEAQAMKDDDLKFQKYLKGKGVIIVDFSAEDREKWKNSPGVKKIAGDWAATMEKQGLPGKKTLAVFLGE